MRLSPMLSILLSTKAKVNRFCSVLTTSSCQRAGAATPVLLCPPSTTQSSAGSRQCCSSVVAQQGSLPHPLAQLTRVIFVRVYGRRLDELLGPSLLHGFFAQRDPRLALDRFARNWKRQD